MLKEYVQYFHLWLMNAASVRGGECKVTHLLSYKCGFFSSKKYFRYWRYSEEMRSMDPGYPKPITIWKGIPESPQGAFVHKENGMQTCSCFNDLFTPFM